jgi:NADP-dependent 3-hydroxy acid dehydrogenase YdfG
MSGALAGRKALVTGGSLGIGAATARLLVEAGAWVGVVARDAGRLERAAAEMGAFALPGDVSSPDDVGRILAGAREAAGGEPDILVNAAGVFELAEIVAMEESVFRRSLEVNLVAPFLLIRAMLPSMLEAGRGHVVTIGSIAGRQAFASNAAYSASKFGVRGLHAVLDAELRGSGVRSSLVEPAATDTPLWDSVDRERHKGLPPREAMMPASAVAEAVVFVLTRPAGVDVRNLLIERA